LVNPTSQMYQHTPQLCCPDLKLKSNPLLHLATAESKIDGGLVRFPVHIEDKDIGTWNPAFVSSSGCSGKRRHVGDHEFGLCNTKMVYKLVRDVARVCSSKAASCTGDT
jgi:hypothetical protein